MRTQNQKLVRTWTEAVVASPSIHQDNPRRKVADAILAATEVGVVVPSILRAKLTDAGFEVRDEKFKDAAQTQEWKHLKQVTVWKGPHLIAQGASGDAGDALLHAMLGYARENPADAIELKAPSAAAAVLGHGKPKA